MTPNSTGIWIGRDGRIALHKGENYVQLLNRNLHHIKYCRTDELDGEWLKVEMPKFPPETPLRCLVRYKDDEYWVRVQQGYAYFYPWYGEQVRVYPSDCEVVPHRDNDQEAVRILGGV